MNPFSPCSWLAANAIHLIVAGLLMCPVPASAQLKVIISGGFSGPYEKLLPEFERTTGIKVTTGSGSSQGTGPQTIGAQLARGVPTDVVILSREGLTDLMAAKRSARGAGAPAMVVSGEAQIAVLPVSEILHAPGVELAGVIAEEIQLHQIFAAAIVAGSKELDAAKRLIAFLASDAAAGAIRAGGMEPLGKRRPE